MSRDIRSFFKIESSKTNKRKTIDDDEEKSSPKSKDVKKKRRIIDSDDEDVPVVKKSSTSRKKSEKDCKSVEVKDIKNLFGGPIKRTERPKEVKPQPKKSAVIDDEDDQMIIKQIDKIEKKEDKKDSPGKENREENEKEISNNVEIKSSEPKEEQISETKAKTKTKVDDISKVKVESKVNESDKKSANSKKIVSPKQISPSKATSSSSPRKSNHVSKKQSSPLKASTSPQKSNPVSKKSPQSSQKSTVSLSQKSTVSLSQKSNISSSQKSTVSSQSSFSTQQALPLKDEHELSFVDKYKPTTVKQIIGQQGPQSNANKLQNWLLNWHKNHGDPKKKVKANPYSKEADGKSFKAALLSGPPGVGKTTTAHLVCEELSFDIVEFNASDTRSKRLLKEEVAQLLSNKSLKGYVNGSENSVSKRHVLIMDEVDGMAGNEDRGGVGELVSLIKESQIPIICTCNDRNNMKMKTLVNYCFDLRFNKPSISQMRSAMMSICFKEGLKLETGAIDAIISGTGNDVRQTLNHLAIYSTTKTLKLNTDDAKKAATISEKDIKIGPWDVIRKVFSTEDHKTMSFSDKSDLFFYDYSIAPLFVQENYLRVKPNCRSDEILDRIAKTADSISYGDLIDRKIRSNMSWSLLPTQAIFASVLPGEYMEGSFKSQPAFPTWLGKNSKTGKRKRLATEIHDHAHGATSGSRLALRLDYAQFMIKALVNPLKQKGLEGIPEAIELLKGYRLLREDIDSLLELTTWGSSKSPWDQIDSKVKAALTRTYNKEIMPYSYSVQTGIKKKNSRVGGDEMEGYGDDENEGESGDDEEESIEKNAFIKVKKTSSKVLNEAAGSSKSAAGTSKSTSKSSSSAKVAKSKGKK